MRPLHKTLLAAILICALPYATAPAGASGVACFEASVSSHMEVDGLHVQVTLTNWVWGDCWLSEPAGVDVYRRTLGATCGPEVLVTDEPLPWIALAESGPSVLGEIVDAGAAPNTAYEYIARAVDAGRNAIAGDEDVVIGYASDGEALIGNGTLVALPDCGWSGVAWIETCDLECFPYLHVSGAPAEVWTFFNNATTYRIYGEPDGRSDPIFCNVGVQQVRITRVVTGPCVVATEPVSWGAVKSIYR